MNNSLLALEHRLHSEELSKNASYGPHIDSRRVPPERQHNFRGTIPPRGNVFSHEPSAFIGVGGRVKSSGKSEITYLRAHVVGQEDIGRLDITVNNPVFMQICDRINRVNNLVTLLSTNGATATS